MGDRSVGNPRTAKMRNAVLTEAAKYVVALLLGMTIGGVLISFKGEDPVFAYKVLLEGALGGRAAIAQTLRWATPAILAGLATTIGFRAGVFNLGVEGQLYMGAFVAALVGYSVALPGRAHMIAALGAGALAGAAYSLLPAVLWMRYGINEVVNTLMLNYVAYLLTEYVVRVFIMSSSGSVVPLQIVTPEIAESARLPLLFPPYQANVGLFIGVLLAILVYFFFQRTVWGYELDIVGRNPAFAAYGGVSVRRLGMLAFIASGLVGGLAGAVEILGVHHKFAAQFSINLGFDGVLIALLAKNDPLGIIPVGLFWGILRNGAYSMERMTSVSRIVIQVVQALFVLFLTVDAGVIRQMLRRRRALRGKPVQKGATTTHGSLV
ncbi:MAG: ABC transporter permease [Firmicutes bacterium]|nr:ABC transporter permease [Bacillota bacterium]